MGTSRGHQNSTKKKAKIVLAPHKQVEPVSPKSSLELPYIYTQRNIHSAPPSNPHVLRQTHATHFPHRVCISGSSDPSNRPSDSLTRRRGHSSTAACHASPSCQNTTGTLHIRRWCGLVISVTLVRQMGYLATCHKLCPKGLQAGLSSEKGEHGRTKLEVSRL